MATQNNIDNAERLIYVDDLTDLFNRRYLYSQLPKELQAAREQNYNLWLFMLDIDNFKLINDSYGHLYGDEIIRGLADIIRKNTKPDDKKIRYAGDEFIIMFTKVEPQNILNMAQRLIAKVNSRLFIEKRSGKEIHITISLGIAGFPQDAAEVTELIRLADKLLYISKQKGKNCFSTAAEITPELSWKKDVLERFPCSILVERENEFSRLKEAAFSKGVKLVLISGELGIGKSRLLHEFEKFVSSWQFTPTGFTSLSAKCEEKHLRQAYYIAGQALYKYLSGLDRLPEEIMQGISESQLSALLSFMPIIKDLCAGLAVKDSVSQGRDDLNEGIIKFLANLSRLKPLCLFLDDFHYVDSQSLEIILRLIQNKELPILVAAAFSPGSLSGSEMSESGFVNAMKEKSLLTYSQNLVLNGLGIAGTQEMLLNILNGVSLSSDFPGLIYKITKGNPLFIEVLLKYIIEKEFIFYQNGSWIHRDISAADLPASIGETIKARIESLNLETKEMIAKAAVIGDDFQIDLLQKIDSGDRGYILDLIESAKKVGLIYESGPSGKDTYSFVTGEIRKVLFNVIGGSQTKQLYSRLGEAQEKLYSDRLSGIAGELYYNFKKAEDLVKAEQYARIIKEGRGLFYDQTMKYARVLLESAQEEKIVLPLSKQSWALIPEIIRNIYIAAVNYILYPAQSQMRRLPIEKLYKIISRVLTEVELLNIGVVELESDVSNIAFMKSAIIVNNRKIGKELNSFFVEAFLALMKSLSIESIVFKKELRVQELSNVIELISGREGGEKSLSELLASSEVTNIQINEITYDTSKKRSKEKESLEEIMLIDYLLGKLPSSEDKKSNLPLNIAAHAEEITQALEKLAEPVSKKSGRDKEVVKAEIAAKSIQKMGSQLLEDGKYNWSKYKEGFAKTLLSMEPALRANIFAAGSAEADTGKEKFDIIKELGLEIPDEIVVDALTKQYLQKGASLEKIKRLAERFLVDQTKKERLIPVLKRELKQIGATEEECDLLFEEQGWEKFSLEEKVDKILTLPAKNFLKILPLIKIDALIRELLAKEQEVKLEAVLERLIGLLEEMFPESRVLGVYLEEILGIFIHDSPDRFLPKFIRRLLKMLSFNHVEYPALFFSVLNPHLEQVLRAFLNTGQFVLIKEIIKVYIKDEQALNESSEIFKQFAAELIKELIRMIDIDFDWTELSEILILLEDYSARDLVEAALFEKDVGEGKYFEAYLRRFIIAGIIKQAPKKLAFANIIKEKFSDARVYIIKNLIDLIRMTEDEELIGILEIPLKSAEIEIRRKVIFALDKIGGRASAGLLSRALMDEDIKIRQDALRSLKNRPDTFAAQILKNCAEDKYLPEDIRQSLK